MRVASVGRGNRVPPTERLVVLNVAGHSHPACGPSSDEPSMKLTMRSASGRAGDGGGEGDRVAEGGGIVR